MIFYSSTLTPAADAAKKRIPPNNSTAPVIPTDVVTALPSSVRMLCRCEKNGLARLFLGLALAAALGCPNFAQAADPVPVDLGTAADFRSLAGGAISGTGHVEGDVGSGTGAIAPAITSSGTIYSTGDAVVITALDDFATAYDEGKNRAHTVLLSPAAYELGGKTLTAGVYKIGAAATLASPVTLNAQGNPDSVFIIQVVGAFGATAAVGNVVLANGARSENVFWIVEGAVSMGAGTHMEGTMLGGAAIAFGAGTTMNGRVMAGLPAGTIALAATAISAPPLPPAPLGGWVWLDSDEDGIQDPAETSGIAGVPVALLQIVSDGLPIDLGAAANFGALAGGAITGTGHVEGDVGSGTGAIAETFTWSGTKYPTGHATVITALNDFATAYNDGKNRPYDVLLSAAAHELGGTTLKSGVYKIGAAATLATPVALNAEGDPDAVFVIQIVGAFGTTAGVGNVVLTNGAQSRNVFWIVEGAVSIGAGAHMEGTILGGAALAFGADATINGRALAGSAAGTVALATTTISSAPGTPAVVKPPSNVVAATVTDANGNYLFGSVHPGIYVIRWDLSSFTTDHRLTEANQGGNDALDSDGVSGDVGELVYTAEIAFPGGTPNLNVDLGLVETLPAIQAAAREDLTTALVTYLLANAYTAENWTALNTARTDGDIAINAATDPASVASAKAAALAAMDAIPTFAETLAAAKAAALDDLTTALATYLESDYTAENWTTLITAKTDGDTAMNAATDPAGVTTATNLALAAMDAVPTMAETLAAAKAAALNDLATALAIHLETNYYSPENWAALITAKRDGDIAINEATDLAGVATATAEALLAMAAVAVVAQDVTGLGTPVAWYETRGITPQGEDDWDAVDYYDSDGDSMLNWQEYLAGTDPTDPQSLLKIVTIRAKVGEPIYLEWIGGTAGPSTPYIVESSQSLLPQDWEPVGTRVRVNGINDWTGELVLPGENRFFRVIASADTP